MNTDGGLFDEHSPQKLTMGLRISLLNAQLHAERYLDWIVRLQRRSKSQWVIRYLGLYNDIESWPGPVRQYPCTPILVPLVNAAQQSVRQQEADPFALRRNAYRRPERYH